MSSGGTNAHGYSAVRAGSKPLTLAVLRRDGQKLTEELSRETYLAYSGHKSTADLQPIYARYAHVADAEALDFALELFHASGSGTDQYRSAQYLLEWQIEVQASRELAELDEREIEWESSAVVVAGDGRTVQYQAAPIKIANERNRERRLDLDAARARVAHSHHAPLRRERLQREKELVEAMGIATDYNSTFERLTGIRLQELAEECRGFLRDTEAMWYDTLRYFLRRSLHITPAQATRSDALALLRASEFDAGFPGDTLQQSAMRQLRDMGLDPDAGGRIIYDVADRPGKRSRAFCAPVRVPGEVYLVLRPHGGLSDYTTLMHEAGHALHFANTDPQHPFEYRWLGDNSVTESYAMLFDHRLQDRGWLSRYTSLPKARLGEFLRMAGFEELHFLRRYSAKLIYEVEAYGEGKWDRLPDLYAQTLTAATTFTHRPEDAFIDFDPGYYSTRYLRAWQLQALLGDYLMSRFDEDWYRNPRAGPWLVRELWSEGQRLNAGEIAARLDPAAELSFAPLLKNIEVLLAA